MNGYFKMNTRIEEPSAQGELNCNHSSSLIMNNENDSFNGNIKTLNEEKESYFQHLQNISQTKKIILEPNIKKSNNSNEQQLEKIGEYFLNQNTKASDNSSETFTLSDSFSRSCLNSSSNDIDSQTSITEVFVNSSYINDSTVKIKEFPPSNSLINTSKKNSVKKKCKRNISLESHENNLKLSSDTFKVSQDLQDLINDITDYETYLNKHTSMHEVLKNQNKKIPIYSSQRSNSIINGNQISSIELNDLQNSDNNLSHRVESNQCKTDFGEDKNNKHLKMRDQLPLEDSNKYSNISEFSSSSPVDDVNSSSSYDSDLKSQFNKIDIQLKSDSSLLYEKESNCCISEEISKSKEETTSLFEQHRQGPGMEYLEELKKSVFNTATYLERCLKKINNKHIIASISSMNYEDNINKSNYNKNIKGQNYHTAILPQNNINLNNIESEKKLELIQLEEAIKNIHESMNCSLYENNETYKKDIKTLRDNLKYVTVNHNKSSKSCECPINTSETVDRVIINNFEDVVSHMENENFDNITNKLIEKETIPSAKENEFEKCIEHTDISQICDNFLSDVEVDTKKVNNTNKQSESMKKKSKTKKINYEFEKNQVYKKVIKKDKEISQTKNDLSLSPVKYKTEKVKINQEDIVNLDYDKIKQINITEITDTEDNSIKQDENENMQRNSFNVVNLSTVTDLMNTANIKHGSSYNKLYLKLKKLNSNQNPQEQVTNDQNKEKIVNIENNCRDEKIYNMNNSINNNTNTKVNTISITDIHKLEQAINNPKLNSKNKYTVIPVSYIQKQKHLMNGIDEKPEYEYRPSLRKINFKNIKTATKSPIKTYIEGSKKKTQYTPEVSLINMNKFQNSEQINKKKYEQNLEKYNKLTKKTMNIFNSKTNNDHILNKTKQQCSKQYLTLQKSTNQLNNNPNKRDRSLVKLWHQRSDYPNTESVDIVHKTKTLQNELLTYDATSANKKNIKKTSNYPIKYSNSRNIYESNENIYYKNRNYIINHSKSSSKNSKENINSVTNIGLHNLKKDEDNIIIYDKNRPLYKGSANKSQEININKKLTFNSTSDNFSKSKHFKNKMCSMKNQPTKQTNKKNEQQNQNKQKINPNIPFSPQMQIMSVSSNNFRINKRIDDLAKPKKHYVKAHREQYKNLLGKEFDVRMQKKYFGNTIYSNYFNKMMKTQSLKDFNLLENIYNLKKQFTDELQNSVSSVVNNSRENMKHNLEMNKNVTTKRSNMSEKNELTNFHNKKILLRKKSTEGTNVEKELIKYIQHWIENTHNINGSLKGTKNTMLSEIYSQMKKEIDNIILNGHGENTLEELLQKYYQTYVKNNALNTEKNTDSELVCKDKKSLKSIPSQYYDAQNKFDNHKNSEQNKDSYINTEQLILTNLPSEDEQCSEQITESKYHFDNKNEKYSKNVEISTGRSGIIHTETAVKTVDFIIKLLFKSVDEQLKKNQLNQKITDKKHKEILTSKQNENKNSHSFSLELINDLEKLLNGYSSDDEITLFSTTDQSDLSLQCSSGNSINKFSSDLSQTYLYNENRSSLQIKNTTDTNVGTICSSHPNIQCIKRSNKNDNESTKDKLNFALKELPIKILTVEYIYFKHIIGNTLHSYIIDIYYELEIWNCYKLHNKNYYSLEENINEELNSKQCDQFICTDFKNTSSKTCINVLFENKSVLNVYKMNSQVDIVCDENLVCNKNSREMQNRYVCSTDESPSNYGNNAKLSDIESSTKKSPDKFVDVISQKYTTDYNSLLKPLLDQCEKCRNMIEKTESEESIANNIRNVLVELNSIQSNKSKINLKIPSSHTQTELYKPYKCPESRFFNLLNYNNNKYNLNDDNFIKFSVLLTVYIIVYLCVFSCLTVKMHCK